MSLLGEAIEDALISLLEEKENLKLPKIVVTLPKDEYLEWEKFSRLKIIGDRAILEPNGGVIPSELYFKRAGVPVTVRYEKVTKEKVLH